MTSELFNIKDDLHQILRSVFLPELNKPLVQQKEFTIELADRLTELKIILEDDEKSSSSILKEFSSDILQLYKNIKQEDYTLPFDKKYSKLEEKFSNIIQNLPEEKIEIQTEENFSTEDKSLGIRFRNNLKKAAFTAYKPVFISQNFVKKTFKRSINEYHWKRKIYLQQLLDHHLKCFLIKSLSELELENKALIEQNYFKQWEVMNKIDNAFYKFLSNKENQINFSGDDLVSIKNSIDERIEKNEKILEEISDEQFRLLKHKYLIAGTQEFPRRKYSVKRTVSCSSKINKKYTARKKHLSIYETAVIEKIKFLEETANIIFSSLDQLQNSKGKVESGLDENILKHFHHIEESLEQSKIRFSGPLTESGLKEKIEKERFFLEDRLNDEIILPFIDILPVDNLLDPLEKLSPQIEARINSISEEMKIVRKEDLNFDIREKDIDEIDLRDIIRSTALYRLTKNNRTSIQKAETELKRESGKIIEISQVSDYNLETALSLIEKGEEKSSEEIIDVAVEGITRAELKNEEIKKVIVKTTEELLEEVKKNVYGFCGEIHELKNTDELIKLKIRVSKEKTSARVKQNLEKGTSAAKEFIPKGISFLKKAFTESGSFIKNIRSKYGIGEAPVSITAETTDFLAETDSIFKRLPIVYQRLFQREALTDERFRVNRIEEIELLNKAYQNWLQERFSSTVLVGEKGAGTSSVLNFTLPSFDKKITILRTELTENIYTEEQLLEFLHRLFSLERIMSFDELVKKLNSSSKKIVVLENFEELFLRTVTGFSALKKMFEIISLTHVKIFWVATCNIYSWNYLDKVINISDYFSFIIKLKLESDKEIEDAILKRHRVSGYNLNFHPAKEDLKNKSFRKLNEKEKQGYLSQKYFSMLNKISRSNIALAQLLWLRSIKNLEDEELQITSLKDLDFSFIKNLSDKKLFTLMSLILHEGLSVEEHSIVFNESMEESRLHLYGLADDGIITKYEDVYKVNFLLYGQVINLLHSRNIIH